MMNQDKRWKILRVLTTNLCNYECVYCHNEGQVQKCEQKKMGFEQFVRFYNVALNAGIEEVRFSGGEPLINIETIKMIEWLNSNSRVEIGLATNGSLVTEEIARRLGNTRVMVTLHFPGYGKEKYYTVTKRSWSSFEKCVLLFDKYNVDYSFNYTLYPATIDAVDDVIQYAMDKGRRVKLLPFLDSGFHNYSEAFVKPIFDKLNSINGSVDHFSKESFYLWTFESGGAVKIIDSPCYGKNIEICKEYGEIRLLPDLSLMNCIFGKSISTDGLNDEELIALFVSLLNELISCSNVINKA